MIGPRTRPGPTRWQWIGGALAAGGVAVFAWANSHLLSVAFATDPGCVAQAQVPSEGGGHRAAKPSC